MIFKDYVTNNNLGKTSDNLSFKELTTIGCGGHIKLAYYPKDIEALAKAYKFICDNNLKYLILGNGSNVLASDYEYDGIVIILKGLNNNIEIFDDYIICSAFYPTIKLAYRLAELELGDLSYMGGIPGLLGGAIYNNSGAYNKNINNDIISVKYINTNGEIVEIDNDMCDFEYRKSIFHKIKGIIVEAKIKVNKMQTKEILAKRKKQRAESQPLNNKSMGSIFKNNPLIPSWRVIDALHLRGFKIGDAAVSMKHTNFIINLGNAKACDILSLIELIETRSRLEFGIILKKEICIV